MTEHVTVTWLTQDMQKLVFEVLSAHALFPGNIFFTYTQVYKWLMMSTVVLTSLNEPIVKLQTLLYSDLPASSFFLVKGSFLPSYDPSHCPLTLQGHRHRYSHFPILSTILIELYLEAKY